MISPVSEAMVLGRLISVDCVPEFGSPAPGISDAVG